MNNHEELFFAKHIQYIINHANNQEGFEYCMTQFLRMSGIYWGLTSLELLGEFTNLKKEFIVEFIKECQSKDGGIAASKGHDSHILYTLSAVQILCIYDCLKEVDVDGIAKYVVSLQQPDGSFYGDKWGEIDTRFSFCAVAILSLLKRLHFIDLSKAVEFVLCCSNSDGGFGCKPNAESHAGIIYCCVGFLSITKQLHRLDSEKLAWWLCERQLLNGGLNGRPEKLSDVCYSWWVLASLSILGRLHWINAEKLWGFILSCQDIESGGFSDRSGNQADVFHTLFGLGALSLLRHSKLTVINPTFCMPQYILERLNIKPQVINT